MNKEWNITIKGNTHLISYFDGTKQNKPQLLVDGKAIIIPKNTKFAFLGVDFPINIEGVECRFVSAFKGIDFVVDSNFVESQKTYTPLTIPMWGWFFVVLSILIPIVSIGGALPTAIACLSSIWCLKISATPFINLGKKILYNILVVLCAWLLFGLILFGMS